MGRQQLWMPRDSSALAASQARGAVRRLPRCDVSENEPSSARRKRHVVQTADRSDGIWIISNGRQLPKVHMMRSTSTHAPRCLKAANGIKATQQGGFRGSAWGDRCDARRLRGRRRASGRKVRQRTAGQAVGPVRSSALSWFSELAVMLTGLVVLSGWRGCRPATPATFAPSCVVAASVGIAISATTSRLKDPEGSIGPARCISRCWPARVGVTGWAANDEL